MSTAQRPSGSGLWLLVLAAAVLAGCSSQPDVPDREEAIELFHMRFPNVTGTTTYEFQDVSCAYPDPPKSARTGQWMLKCEYDVIRSKKIMYKTFRDHYVQPATFFWIEDYNHAGDDGWR